MLQQLSPPPAAHTQQVVVYIEASANVSPIGDDAMSWNTTPMSSIGTASPTESSQRQSVVCSYHEAVLLQEMNHHAGAGPTEDLIATMPPSPVSPIKAPCMAASAAAEGHLHDGHSSCNTTMDMDDDDEIVGVTAEGELLFRKRDGGHPSEWTRRRSAPEVTTHRPTPHRTQPRPPSLAVPDMTDVVSPPAEARALFAPSSAADVTPPSQVVPPPTLRDSTRRHAEQHGTPLMVLSAEEIRFAQLALRVRDRENDLFCEHVHEEFRRHAQAKDAQYQQELDARYRRAAWDLRRF